MRIGSFDVGTESRPFVIAEMSGNHNQSLERALAIVDAAAAAGVQAVKIQTYTAETMTLDMDRDEFFISDPESPWKGSSLFDLYKQAYTPWEWHEPIFARCREHGMLGFSSPFDETAVEFLDGLDVACFKIASFESTHLPLVRKAASTGKPVIISTGMATSGEIDETVSAARQAGCRDIALLKCTSTYPASPENSNLRTIPHMRDLHQCEVGLSDHTLGIGVAVASVAFGATLIEKHFTLARADGGVDSVFSLEPDEMSMLVAETERAWKAVGSIAYGPAESETKSLIFRRSIYVAKNIRQGDRLSRENIRIIRPGYGLSPNYYDAVLGMVVARDIRRGTPLSWDLLKSSDE